MHELWDVIAAQELSVVVGIALGQFEGFRTAAVCIDVGEEGTGEGAVVASAAHHEPATIARP